MPKRKATTKRFKPDESKVAKEEPPEDVTDVHPIPEGEMAASVSVGCHVKGEITAEKLVHRNNRECELCSFTALCEDRVTQHMEQKHKIFVCRFCKTEYSSKFQQHKHFVTCEKLLEMRKKVKKQCEDIKDNNLTHDAIRCMHVNVKCPICKAVYKNMFDLGDHRLHPCKQYAVRLFACSGCKIQFQTSSGLKSHLIAKSTEKDWKCYNTGVLSFESLKIPKFTRRVAHIHHEEGVQPSNNPITAALVPIKHEPTEPDEIHNDKVKLSLVAAHLLSDHDGDTTHEYYYAMRKMFYRIDCPFCKIQCRTFGALHTHGLNHHPPYERCLFQCAGCEQTFQTPTGLGQHLKREFDKSNANCYNTINLVRKQDYLGPVTGWNKTNKNKLKHLESNLYAPKADVKHEPDYEYEEVVKKEEPDDFGYQTFGGPSTSTPDTLFTILNSHSSLEPHYMSGELGVKDEPIDDPTSAFIGY